MLHLLERISEIVDMGDDLEKTCQKINSLICQRDNIAGDIDSLAAMAKLEAQSRIQKLMAEYVENGSDPVLVEKCLGFCDFLAERNFWTPKQWDYLAYHVLPKIAGK